MTERKRDDIHCCAYSRMTDEFLPPEAPVYVDQLHNEVLVQMDYLGL